MNGCDIVFVINGERKPDLVMLTDLTSQGSNFQNIADWILKTPKFRDKLSDFLGKSSNTLPVSEDTIRMNGITHNSILRNLVLAYPHFNWDGIRQDIKLLAVELFSLYGSNMANLTIENGGNPIYIINPSNYDLVNNLHSYLLVLSKINNPDEETKAILSDEFLTKIVSQLLEISKVSERDLNKLGKLEKKENRSKKEEEELIRLLNKVLAQEHFENVKISNPKLLLLDYQNYSSEYHSLSIKVGNERKGISSFLKNVLRNIEGKSVKEAVYNDVFANEVMSSCKISKGLSSLSNSIIQEITRGDMLSALGIKLDDAKTKLESMSNKFSNEYKELEKIIKSVDKFLNKTGKTEKDWIDIIRLLIDYSDDEFSYDFYKIDKEKIYLTNVPRTLEQRYGESTRKTISLLKFEESYKGFNIYSDKSGNYYFDRHILTTKSYGRKYPNRDACKEVIDNHIKYSPIYKDSLIEFKFLHNRELQSVWIPNRFVPGQVIKVLKADYKLDLLLNKDELNLIYSSGINNSNTLATFYDYVLSLVNSPNYLRDKLEKTIDTAEKAVCFIYALNEKEGVNRKKISEKTFEDLLNSIPTEYEYYTVESVAPRGFFPTKTQYKLYKQFTKEGTEEVKSVIKTNVIKVKDVDIRDNLISYDNNTGLNVTQYQLLQDLADKIKNKLGVTVHIETLSSLETLFKLNEWGEMSSEVRGFVRDGLIYINASNCDVTDLFHEYTHLMLGVLKSKNYDNYKDLVKLVATNEKNAYLYKSIKEKYPYLAALDLYEEVFVASFSRYLQGYDFGEFLNGNLDLFKKTIDEKMGSIFGAEKIDIEFYNSSLKNAFNLFGHDLSILSSQGNGLEIPAEAKSSRQATNWIESLIKLYEENKGKDENVGIYEDCTN